jgi:hypothetical protein
LYLLAHGRIYANHAAMTPGGTPETVDGMSQAKIGRIIDATRHKPTFSDRSHGSRPG